MRDAGKILLYALAVVLLGALLAPWLWHLGRWAVETDLVPQLRRVKFARYFNRALLIAALALLVPFVRWMGVRSWRELSLEPNPRRWRDLLFGFSTGTVGLACVGAIIVLAQIARVRGSFAWSDVAFALGTGIIVGVIEEAFFRGALLGVVRREMRWPPALVFVSVVYAVLHFVRPDPHLAKNVQVTWSAGFALVPHIFWRFLDPSALVASFLTLAVVGWTLGYVVVRTRSLYLAIGLHAGWVFALKTFGVVTKRGAHAASVWLGREPIDGVLPLLLVGLTAVSFVWLLRHRAPEPRGSIDAS